MIITDNKVKNVPKLRFGEFVGEWEVKRLESLFSEFKSGNGITASSIFETGKYPVYGGNGLRGYTNTYTHDGFYFLIGRQGALCGNINRSFGKSFISEHAVACKANETSDTEWLAQRLDYYNLNRLSESSAQPGLAVNKLLRFKLFVPKKEEQQKIANFLSAIDKKIEQISQKLSLLEQYKKGVMQQIFSQKIRFKDDNGEVFADWEVKRLGEIANLTSSKRVYLSDYVESGIPFYRGKEITELKQNKLPSDILYISEKSFKDFKEKYGTPQKDDILITAVGTLANIYRVPNNDNFYFKDGNLIWLKKISINASFLALSLEYNKTEILKVSIGSTQKALTIVELDKFAILIPKDKAEQQKIANFLSSIDNKIQQTQAQLEQMQEFKKGLLQQLFI